MNYLHRAILSSLIIFIVPIHMFSQNYMSANDLSDLEQIISLDSEEEMISLRKKFPIQTINGRNYLSFIGKTNPDFDIKKLKKQGCIVHSTVNQLFTLKVPIKKLQIAKNLKGLSFLSISKKMNCALDKAVSDVRADSVHMGLGNLPQGYYGENVIVGVTDWGFDYTSQYFTIRLYSYQES